MQDKTMSSTAEDTEKLLSNINELQRKKAELEFESQRLDQESSSRDASISSLVQKLNMLQEQVHNTRKETAAVKRDINAAEVDYQQQLVATQRMQTSLETSKLDPIKNSTEAIKRDLDTKLIECSEKFEKQKQFYNSI